jgi:hypothetical protein
MRLIPFCWLMLLRRSDQTALTLIVPDVHAGRSPGKGTLPKIIIAADALEICDCYLYRSKHSRVTRRTNWPLFEKRDSKERTAAAVFASAKETISYFVLVRGLALCRKVILHFRRLD